MIFSTQDKPFFPQKLTEKLTMARGLGFDQYEADGSLMLNHLDELCSAVKKTNVPISTICGGYGGWIGDFDEEKRHKGIKDIISILEICGNLNVTGIVLPAAWAMCTLRLPPHTAPRSKGNDRAVLHDSLHVLDKVALNTGTWIFLEPLNRYEDHMLNTQEDAKEVLVAGNYKRVKTTADLYHMNIEERNVPESFRIYADQVGHVHICDSNRSEPGEGHIDFVKVFAALKQGGYAGIFAFEGRVTGVPAVESYKRSLEYVKECWEKA